MYSGYIAAERHALILRGVENCLRYIGLLSGEPTTREALGEEPTIIQSAADPTGYLMAPRRGFWEACVDPMATVTKGQLLGRVHNPEEPSETPVGAAFRWVGPRQQRARAKLPNESLWRFGRWKITTRNVAPVSPRETCATSDGIDYGGSPHWLSIR